MDRPVDSLRLWWKSRAGDIAEHDTIENDRWFRAIGNYLASRAPAGHLPGRQHIDAIELRQYMGFINLVDVLGADDRRRFRFRLMGTAQVEANRRDMTGKFLEDVLSPEDRMWVTDRFERVVRLHQPDIAARVLLNVDQRQVRYRRAVFPLAGDGKTVDMLLIIHRYPDRAQWCGP